MLLVPCCQPASERALGPLVNLLGFESCCFTAGIAAAGRTAIFARSGIFQVQKYS